MFLTFGPLRFRRKWEAARLSRMISTSLLILCAMPMAHAAIVPITAGSGRIETGWQSFSVFGPGNVSISGSGSVYVSGLCDDWMNQYCKPGKTYHLNAGAPDDRSSMSGVVSVSGLSASYDVTPQTRDTAGIGYFLDVTVPDIGNSLPSTLTFTAPFSAIATASIAPRSGLPEGLYARMNGFGTATILLQLASCGAPCGGATYKLQSAQFVFVTTPEPSTFLTGALTLLVLGLARRRSAKAGAQQADQR